jgi:hypothetical protein
MSVKIIKRDDFLLKKKRILEYIQIEDYNQLAKKQ